MILKLITSTKLILQTLVDEVENKMYSPADYIPITKTNDEEL